MLYQKYKKLFYKSEAALTCFQPLPQNWQHFESDNECFLNVLLLILHFRNNPVSTYLIFLVGSNIKLKTKFKMLLLYVVNIPVTCVMHLFCERLGIWDHMVITFAEPVVDTSTYFIFLLHAFFTTIASIFSDTSCQNKKQNN